MGIVVQPGIYVNPDIELTNDIRNAIEKKCSLLHIMKYCKERTPYDSIIIQTKNYIEIRHYDTSFTNRVHHIKINVSKCKDNHIINKILNILYK